MKVTLLTFERNTISETTLLKKEKLLVIGFEISKYEFSLFLFKIIDAS